MTGDAFLCSRGREEGCLNPCRSDDVASSRCWRRRLVGTAPRRRGRASSWFYQLPCQCDVGVVPMMPKTRSSTAGRWRCVDGLSSSSSWGGRGRSSHSDSLPYQCLDLCRDASVELSSGGADARHVGALGSGEAQEMSYIHALLLVWEWRSG